MRDNERVYQMTNAVVFYSNTGQSESIANYLSQKLGYDLYDVYDVADYVFDNLIFVFPVHCQSLPDVAKAFLSRIKAQNVALIASYGRMCKGNAIFEACKRYNLTVVAAVYVPAKHTYIDNDEFDDFKVLDCIIDKMQNPCAITIARSYKNPFSNFFKRTRSRMGVRIFKNDKCNGCGECNRICKNNAINLGDVNKNCIRCLKCVKNCPNGALKFSLRLPMRLYLKKKMKNDTVLYI